MISQFKVRNKFFLNSFFSINISWMKLVNSIFVTLLHIQLLRKNILNYLRPRSKDIFNVSHPKGIFFLTCLRVGLSHSRKHKFKHSFIDTLNPIYICSFDIETLNHFFLHCPRFTNERQNVPFRIKSIIHDILRKTDSSIKSILLYGDPSFSADLTPTRVYPQKGLNLLSLNRLDS